ncbi:MAG TPA: hypothetical protein VM582_00675, partial [Candidatus Thermoplasmatota archaeon]|nr:hypothetical protein [Candidatus Thermoplasmatota archaeon]
MLAVVAAGGLLYVIVVLVVAIVEWFAERPFLAGATVGSAAGVAACWAYLRARRWWRESIVPMQAAWRLKRASALKLPRVTLAAEAGTVSSGADPRAQRIEEALRQYRPLQAYSSEIGYHAELAGSLRGSFSTLEVEVQRGQSRPDIVIGDVAIE